MLWGRELHLSMLQDCSHTHCCELKLYISMLWGVDSYAQCCGIKAPHHSVVNYNYTIQCCEIRTPLFSAVRSELHCSVMWDQNSMHCVSAMWTERHCSKLWDQNCCEIRTLCVLLLWIRTIAECSETGTPSLSAFEIKTSAMISEPYCSNLWD